jgi:hypothetical protein
LQRFNFSQNQKGEWLLNSLELKNDEVYTIAVSDFLMKGFDIPFLTPDHEGVLSVYEPTKTEPAKDIRKAIILFLKALDQ